MVCLQGIIQKRLDSDIYIVHSCIFPSLPVVKIYIVQIDTFLKCVCVSSNLCFHSIQYCINFAYIGIRKWKMILQYLRT